MATRKVDLKKERERAKKPGAGHPINYPPPLPKEVEEHDQAMKKLKKPPSQR